MDRRITDRIEQIGGILAIAQSKQLPLLEKYLKRNHAAAWELCQIAQGGRRSRVELAIAYKGWLLKHDRAWVLADTIQQHPTIHDWGDLAEKTGYSRETCRQVRQALQRGGMP